MCPKKKRLKLDKKAVKYYLVGYADNVKGYCPYNPRSNKVITSRDVIILERSDSPEMTQVNISEGQGTSLGHTKKHDDTETDSEQTVSTVMGTNDSTYVEEQSDTSSSSDDFSDCSPMKDVKNLDEISQPFYNRKREEKA